VIDLLLETLRSDASLSTLRLDPPWPRTRSRAVNFVRSATWDLWTAPHLASSSEVFIAPSNIGRPAGRSRMLLVLHDTMVLDVPSLFDRGYAWWARLAFGPSVRRADLVLCPSQYTAERVRERWGTQNVIVVPYPTPLMPSAPVHPRTTPGHPAQLLMVGVTEPHKQQAVGIEAGRILRSIGRRVELTLIGPAGRAEREVQSAIASADPTGSWIRRRVNVSDSDLVAAYQNADVLLQPSRLEGFGLPVLEAAAFGLPALHSGEGALSELAPSGAVGGSDPVRYARRVRALLESADYQRHSAAALSVASQHTPERFRETVLDVVHGMIGGHQ
jgi:glycosyltransferase involved in cell wall biosynthesis